MQHAQTCAAAPCAVAFRAACEGSRCTPRSWGTLESLTCRWLRGSAETPWKAIGLAVALLCIGTLFLTLGVLALQGNLHVEDKGTPRELVRAPPEAQHTSRRTALVLAARAAAQCAQRRSPFATQAFALTVLGSITFVPGACVSPAARAASLLSLPTHAGFYYTRLAFYAYKGYAGYSFEDIPDVD